MVKRIASSIVALALMLGTASAAFASGGGGQISSDHSSVVNDLPHITVFCESDSEVPGDVSLLVDGEKAKINSTDIYSNYEAPTNYYMLVDTSTSMKSEDFADVKEALGSFCKSKLRDDDRVFLVPVGDEEEIKIAVNGASPKSKELDNAITGLKNKSNYSYVFRALDIVSDNIDSSQAEAGEILQRNVIFFFTDGKDNTRGGSTLKEEAPKNLKRQGVPLYAFAVGKYREGKDNMKSIANSLNGRLYDGKLKESMADVQSLIMNSLVIDAEAVNAKAAAEDGRMDIVVDSDSLSQSVKLEGVEVNKSGELSNSTGYTIKKLLASFWWIILIVAIAVIAFVSLATIKKHKGIVNIEGETVFNDNVEKKTHIKVTEKEYHVKTVSFDISVKGSPAITKKVEITESLIVGRSDMCDVSFDDPAMGRQHFAISLEDGQLYVEDLDSKNGTFLNSVRLTSKLRINDGDIITAGQSRISIRWY